MSVGTFLREPGRLFRHQLFRNTAALFIVQISSYLAPLLILPYLSRVLSTDHFGLIAFATSFNWYFLTLVEYGFNLSATRRIAIYREDATKVSKIFSSVMAAKTFLTVVGFILMIAIVMATPKLRPNLTLFMISYLAVIGDLLFPLWLFQGLQKMENLVWRDLCAKGVALVLIFAFVRRDADYLWAAGFQAGSTVIAGIVGLITVPILSPVRWVLPSIQEALMAMREGWPVFVSMVALSLTNSTNILVLGLYAGPTDVALYTAPSRLVVAVRMLVSPVVTALYPHLSHMAANSRNEAVAFLRKYALVLAGPFFAASLVLLGGASPIIRILYGSKYVASIEILRILAFSPLLLALQQVYSTFFMLAFGYEKEWSRIILMGTALNFVVLFTLIYTVWPPAAVAVTGILVDVFAAIATYVFYRRHTSPLAQPLPA